MSVRTLGKNSSALFNMYASPPLLIGLLTRREIAFRKSGESMGWVDSECRSSVKVSDRINIETRTDKRPNTPNIESVSCHQFKSYSPSMMSHIIIHF